MNKKWLIIGTISFSVGLSLSLIINRDIKQAALTGLLSVPATIAGVSVTEYQRRQKLNDKISKLQRQLQDLVQQETELNNSIALLSNRVKSLKQQEENITEVIKSLNVDRQRCLERAKRSQSELETIQNQVDELSNCKSSLEPEIITLETKLLQLKEEETALSKLLADLANSQQQIEVLILEFNTEFEHLREQKVELHQSLTSLNQEKQEIDLNCAASQTKLSQLQNSVLEQQQLKEQLKKELAILKQQTKPIPPESQKPESTSIDWADRIEDANIRQVFLHLDRHNSLTEAELNQMLGSPRQARRFAGNLEQHLTQIPFSVRVETTSNGKRYVKY